MRIKLILLITSFFISWKSFGQSECNSIVRNGNELVPIRIVYDSSKVHQFFQGDNSPVTFDVTSLIERKNSKYINAERKIVRGDDTWIMGYSLVVVSNKGKSRIAQWGEYRKDGNHFTIFGHGLCK